VGTVLQNLKLFGPEVALTVLLCLHFLTDAFIPKIRGTVFQLILTVTGCAVAAVLTCSASKETPSLFFSNLVANDQLSAFFRYFFLFSCAVGAYVAHGSKEIEKHGRTEFHLMLVAVTFGMSLMAISTNLLSLYIGIETVSIVSFVMAGFARDNKKSNEASFKYLVFGALASGLMIYGFSLIYGLTGSLNYGEIAKALQASVGQQPFVLALAFFLAYAGLAYKISSFPMHFWTPDVYEGAPTPVATFFSVGPKAAGFAAMARLFLGAFAIKSGEGTAAVWKAIEGVPLVELLAVVSAATMVVGNLSAIAQTNARRILAYSSIAHVGYLLMGLVTLDGHGLAAILFYLIAYCVMNIGAFWVVGIVSDMKGSEELEAFRGLGWKNPVLGVCMAIFLFSLTGIPLFSGFVGKFMIFGAVIRTEGFLWLALLGVLNSIVSLYYYLKILKAMWLDRPSSAISEPLPLYHAAGLVALAIPTIVLGLFFTPIIHIAEKTLARFL
jgi:NADH-quinone oxidoreductase subunit N